MLPRILLQVLACALVLGAVSAELSGDKLRYTRGGDYRIEVSREILSSIPDTPSMPEKRSDQIKLRLSEFVEKDRLRMRVHRLDLDAQKDGLSVDTPGQAEATELKFDYAFDALGLLGPGVANSNDFDGAAWSRLAPLADLLLGLGVFGLPRLPEAEVVVGDAWVGERKMNLSVPGAPGLVMKLVSRYKVAGHAACSAKRCLRIEEELDLLGSEQRAWRSMNVQLDVDGKGRAEHVFDVLGGRLISSHVKWKAKIELRQIFSTTRLPLHTLAEIQLEYSKK